MTDVYVAEAPRAKGVCEEITTTEDTLFEVHVPSHRNEGYDWRFRASETQVSCGAHIIGSGEKLYPRGEEAFVLLCKKAGTYVFWLDCIRPRDAAVCDSRQYVVTVYTP